MHIISPDDARFGEGNNENRIEQFLRLTRQFVSFYFSSFFLTQQGNCFLSIREFVFLLSTLSFALSSPTPSASCWFNVAICFLSDVLYFELQHNALSLSRTHSYTGTFPFGIWVGLRESSFSYKYLHFKQCGHCIQLHSCTLRTLLHLFLSEWSQLTAGELIWLLSSISCSVNKTWLYASYCNLFISNIIAVPSVLCECKCTRDARFLQLESEKVN